MAHAREAEDGWQVLLALHGRQHRLWFEERPNDHTIYAISLALDDRFEASTQAARLFWRDLSRLGRRAPSPFTSQQRARLKESLRALDAHLDGASYRAIAESLFGASRIPERVWKTHDLRSKTIRLAKGGLKLMRGGYRRMLLCCPRAK